MNFVVTGIGRTLWLGLFSLLLMGQIAQALADNASILRFQSDGAVLEGTLYLPEGDGPFPAVVAMHGAGPPERDGQLMYRHLAKTLTDARIATFLFDRRDIAIPPDQRTSLDYRVLAADGAAAARAIAKHERVHAGQIGVWGVSQGGWLGPMAYSYAPEQIAFLILVSPSGDGPAEQMMYTAERALRDAGFDDDTVATGLALRRKLYAYYRHEIDRQSAQAAIDEHKNEPWFDLLYIGRSVVEDPTQSGWYHEMRYEPWEYFAQIRVPVALFYAEYDPFVSVDRSEQVLRAALAEAGNENYQVHRVPTTGHAMMANERELLASGREITINDFSAEYARRMVDFIHGVIGAD